MKSSRHEIDYFTIEGAIGGSQDWFADTMMNLGGCGAVTACDLCVFLARDFGSSELCPFDPRGEITKGDYIRFSDMMKPYLHPRARGIDRITTYIDGLERYLDDKGRSLTIVGVHGDDSADAAAASVVRSIDRGLPVPYLLLLHEHELFDDYEWHWFNLAGYDRRDGELFVRAVTYGAAKWLPFFAMWATGTDEKGGLVEVIPD